MRLVTTPEIVRREIPAERLAVGQVVYCSYWNSHYTVTENHGNGSISVRWDDGRAVTHCTPLTKGDLLGRCAAKETRRCSFRGHPCREQSKSDCRLIGVVEHA